MPERAYFGMRYALPGYTFILMAFLIILPHLQTLFFVNDTSINTGLVSAFLAFFTLLEGSAIGFLVSQFWYWFYDLVFRKDKLCEARKFLQEHYGLVEGDIHKETIFLDYISHLADDKILAYTERRWDLLHTLGSTLVAVLLGSFIGLLIRVCWSGPDPFLYDVFVIFVFLFFFAVLRWSYNFVDSEHERMALIMVRSVWYSGKFPPEDAQKIFKNYFQEKPAVQNKEDNKKKGSG